MAPSEGVFGDRRKDSQLMMSLPFVDSEQCRVSDGGTAIRVPVK